MKSIQSKQTWIVIGLGALLFLPLLGQVTLFDWDEANFAECAREMILRGEFGSVTVDFEPFYEKPPLFFWLQVLSMQLLGIGEYAARLPSAIIGILSLWLMLRIGRRWYCPRQAWLWVLLYVASFTPHIYFKSGIIDPTFNFFIYLSIYLYFKDSKWRWSAIVLSAISMALAIITKGPVALLILGLVILVYHFLYHRKSYTQWIFYVRHLSYVFFIAFFASIWYIYMYAQDGGEYIRLFIDYQLELLTHGVATHGQPWYYHFVALIVGCFPASVLLLDRSAWRLRTAETLDHDGARWTRVMIVLFWVVLILFSLVKTKIVHYSSLCYLPLTYLAARYIDERISSGRILNTVQSVLFWLVGGGWVLALISLPIVAQSPQSIAPYIGDANTLNALTVPVQWSYAHSLVGVVLLVGLVLFWRYKKREPRRAILSLVAASVLTIQLVLYLFVPKLSLYSQGESVAYYKSFADKSVDLRTYNYKSYAVFFYAERTAESKNFIPKYYVCHKAQAPGIIEQAAPPLTEINTHYNFTLLKEIPHENQAQNTQQEEF